MKRFHIAFTATLILTAALLSSCGNKQNIIIEGTLENGAGKMIYIEEMTPESRLFIDSVALDSKGHFRFKYPMPYKTFYNVHVSSNNYVVVLPDFGETIVIDGDYNNLSYSYTLKGGKDSQLLWQLQDYSNEGSRILDDIVKMENESSRMLSEGKITQYEYDIRHAHTDSVYLAAFTQQQQYVVRFIEDNLGSLSTLIALYKPFNNHPLINPADCFEFYEAVLESLQEELPDNPHTLHFKNMVERTRYQYVQ